MTIEVTSEMIEAAAVAPRDCTGNKSGRGKRWEKLPDNIRAMYRAEAEATLRAGLALANAGVRAGRFALPLSSPARFSPSASPGPRQGRGRDLSPLVGPLLPRLDVRIEVSQNILPCQHRADVAGPVLTEGAMITYAPKWIRLHERSARVISVDLVASRQCRLYQPEADILRQPG